MKFRVKFERQPWKSCKLCSDEQKRGRLTLELTNILDSYNGSTITAILNAMKQSLSNLGDNMFCFLFFVPALDCIHIDEVEILFLARYKI